MDAAFDRRKGLAEMKIEYVSCKIPCDLQSILNHVPGSSPLSAILNVVKTLRTRLIDVSSW